MLTQLVGKDPLLRVLYNNQAPLIAIRAAVSAAVDHHECDDPVALAKGVVRAQAMFPPDGKLLLEACKALSALLSVNAPRAPPPNIDQVAGKVVPHVAKWMWVAAQKVNSPDQNMDFLAPEIVVSNVETLACLSLGE